MRILLVSNLFPPEVLGGYEMVACEMAQRLAGAGHEVLVVTSPLVNHARELPEAGFAIRRSLAYSWLSWNPACATPRHEAIDLRNILALRQAIADFAPEQVLLFNIDGLGPLGLVVFLHEAGFEPAIYLGDNTFHNASARKEDYAAFCRLFGAERALRALHPLVVSELIVEEIEDDLGVQLTAPFYVPGWVPDDLPLPVPAPAEGPLRLVFSSRIASHKGTGILLAAARLLLDRGERNFRVDVYGAGQVADFVQHVHAEGLAEHIRYKGMQERAAMIGAFARYEALLFPTRLHEPLGLVPFEAAAQGCIPVMTAQIGAAEWLTAADCLKIERTPEALAEAIQRLLAMPPGERAAWRRRIARRVRQDFGAGLWLDRIERRLRALPPRRQALAPQKIQNALFAIVRVGGLTA